MTLVYASLGVWAIGWLINVQIARHFKHRSAGLLAATILGLTLIIMWQLIVTGLEISPVILPDPIAWA